MADPQNYAQLLWTVAYATQHCWNIFPITRRSYRYNVHGCSLNRVAPPRCNTQNTMSSSSSGIQVILDAGNSFLWVSQMYLLHVAHPFASRNGKKYKLTHVCNINLQASIATQIMMCHYRHSFFVLSRCKLCTNRESHFNSYYAASYFTRSGFESGPKQTLFLQRYF